MPSSLSLHDYDTAARALAIFPDNVRLLYEDGRVCALYPFFGLASEIGELLEKMKKIMRYSDGIISEKMRLNMAHELGDVLWYVSACANELNTNLERVAALNLHKLEDRANRNKLQGSGDDR